jgi:hypothetical protein
MTQEPLIIGAATLPTKGARSATERTAASIASTVQKIAAGAGKARNNNEDQN